MAAMDDLDALLDEAESLFTKKPATRRVRGISEPVRPNQARLHQARSPSAVRRSPRRSSLTPSENPVSPKSEATSLLSDLADLSATRSRPHPVGSSALATSTSSYGSTKSGAGRLSSAARRVKCNRLILAGSCTPMGLSTGSRPRACDRARCTKCDHAVLHFEDARWQSDCEVLFFRNYVPNRVKLSTKIDALPGWRAYACQCQWHSTDSSGEGCPSGIPWVCGKHPLAGSLEKA